MKFHLIVRNIVLYRRTKRHSYKAAFVPEVTTLKFSKQSLPASFILNQTLTTWVCLRGNNAAYSLRHGDFQ